MAQCDSTAITTQPRWRRSRATSWVARTRLPVPHSMPHSLPRGFCTQGPVRNLRVTKRKRAQHLVQVACVGDQNDTRPWSTYRCAQLVDEQRRFTVPLAWLPLLRPGRRADG
jgi:hypothetical protein